MPSSIRVALGAAVLVALVGAISTATWAADLWGGGAGARWLASLPSVGPALERAGSPLFLLAAAVVPVVLRREAGPARIVRQLALLGAITLGVMASGFGSTEAVRMDAGLAGMLAMTALLAVLAAALSRPSAQAWLGSSAG